MSVAVSERVVVDVTPEEQLFLSMPRSVHPTRVLITGSEGTLGRPLSRELRRRGFDVYGLDMMHSASENHSRADVAEARQVDRVFDDVNPHYVYHLAAEFGRHNGEEFYEQLWRTNVIGIRNVMEACARHVSPMIFASSSEIYGERFEGAPLLAEDLPEKMPPVHSNEYAISKWTNELQIGNFVRRTGLEVLVARFFNAYGPGEHYHPYRSVVAQFVYRALRGIPWDVYEGYSRTFMHIDDFIPTLATMVDRFTPGVYNVGGTDYRAVSELSEIVIKTVGCSPDLARSLPREEHNVVSKRPDISRARALFGHDPRITLEEGVPGTVAWMKNVMG